MDSRVLELPELSLTFPADIHAEIHRDNFLQTIDDLLAVNDIVLVKGEEGSGKTTLLKQYVKRHNGRSISSFIRQGSRWAFDPATFQADLYGQIHWLINGQEFNGMTVDEGILRTSYIQLQRMAQRRNVQWLFVIDGLHEVPSQDSTILQDLLDILPFGLPGFRFVISQGKEEVSERLRGSSRRDSMHITAFTKGEATHYFEELMLSAADFDDIFITTRGMPGKLSAVKRILQSASDRASVLNELATQMPNLFEVEWRQCDDEPDETKYVLAIVAFDKIERSVEELAQIAGVEQRKVASIVEELSFMHLGEDGSVRYISDSFRRFAASRLSAYHESTRELIIAHLLKTPFGEQAITLLPDFYEEAGRGLDLIAYITPEHIGLAVESSQSLGRVKRLTEKGFAIAASLNRHADVLRFSLYGAVLAELEGAQSWRTEVAARTSLPFDEKAALVMARRAPMLEDRLHLLALMTRVQREKNETISDYMVDEIRRLYEQYDPSNHPGRSFAIAADLIFVAPDLAISMVGRAATSDVSGIALDVALAKMSLDVTQSALNPGRATVVDSIESHLTTITSQIQDPRLSSFLSAATAFVQGMSASEVLTVAKKIHSSMDRIYLLRRWTVQNPDRDDAWEVVEAALALVIDDAELAPSATMLREIAVPLPFISDKEKQNRLIGSFRAQFALLEKLGPSEEVVEFELLLARTLFTSDPKQAVNDIVNLYITSIDIEEPIVRGAALARIWETVDELDDELIKKENIDELIAGDLQNIVVRVLADCADQYVILRDIIGTVARIQVSEAIKIAEGLNIQKRRDQAHALILTESIRVSRRKVNQVIITDVLSRIVDEKERDRAIVKTIQGIAMRGKMREGEIEVLKEVLNLAPTLNGAVDRIWASLWAMKVLSNSEGKDWKDGFYKKFSHSLREAWLALPAKWYQIDCGYEMVRRLAEFDSELATNFLEEIDTVQSDGEMTNSASALSLIGLVRLAIRAFGGLLSASANEDSDESKLAGLIEMVPSPVERAGLWCELGVQYYLHGRASEISRCVETHVMPVLEGVRASDRDAWNALMVEAAPAMYVANSLTALVAIADLAPSVQEDAIRSIALLLISGTSPNEPLESSEFAKNAKIGSISEIVELAKLVPSDNALLALVRLASNAVTSRGGRVAINAQKRADLALRLEEICKKRLPMADHIQHKGYLLCCLAEIARIRGDNKKETWTNLVEDARSLPNAADKTMVLAGIASRMPQKEHRFRLETFKEAVDSLTAIPVLEDRLNRLVWISEESEKIDGAFTKQCLSEAMKLSLEGSQFNYEMKQKRIVDLAHRIDPEFASTLASLADEDPARAVARNSLDERLRTLDLKRRWASGSNEVAKFVEVDGEEIAQAAWMLLGSLNSEIMNTHSPDRMLEVLRKAHKLEMSEFYAVACWYIENANQRFQSRELASKHVRPLFEACISSGNLAVATSPGVTLVRKRIYSLAKVASDDGRVYVSNPGDRASAIGFISRWLTETKPDFLVLFDPFFGPDDLEFLQLITDVCPDCAVRVVTSEKQQSQLAVATPWEVAYRENWRQRSIQQAPETQVIVMGLGNTGDSPIHDRWLISEGSGMRWGTSFRDIGRRKISELSVLTSEESLIIDEKIRDYYNGRKREHNGERVRYTTFSL